MAKGETSPLLGTKHTQYKSSNSDNAIGSSSSSSSSSKDIDAITIMTSNPPSIKVVVSETNENPSAGMDDVYKRRLHGANIYAIFAGIYVAVVLASLDNSIVATIYPQIGTEFKRSNEIIWIATSYMLSFTALQPLYGRISDVFGRKTALLFATIVFFIGSFLCGAASNLWILVIARAIAGVGGGGINCMTTVINADLVPIRERGKFQSYGNIAFTVGSILGAPLGGLLNDTLGWRSCFYINLPFLLITIFIASKLLTNYNLEENTNETFRERLNRIDYAGAITVVVAVICFLVATSLGGNIKPWSDPIVLGCFAGAFVFTVLFCVVEAKFALHPLMPWQIISSRTPFACSMVNLWCLMATNAVIYITPLYFQALLGLSPSLAGIYFTPKIIFVCIGSVYSGQYMSRVGEFRKITIAAAILSMIAMFGYTSWTPQTSKVFMLVCLAADGLAMGIVITAVLIGLHSCVKHSEMATITSMSYLFRSVGGVVGVSLTSAIFQAIVKNVLVKKITGPNADLYIEIARKSMTEVRNLLPADILDDVLDSYQIALRYTYAACAVMSCLTLLSSLFIQGGDLSSRRK
ncbi:major facilitator superfamily domain-containing protein [Choanephora cucurbitarum]|nr:major facilitator superfamily domain-containing protein [Choanephora cucurbitarum]